MEVLGLSRRRLAIRVVLAAATLLLLVMAILLAIALLPVLGDPTPRFVDRKGTLVEARETARFPAGADSIRELTLVSSSGLEVDLAVRLPAGAHTPRPAIVLLAGQRTGRDAVRFTADTRGIVVAALSYPYRGDASAGALERLADLPAIQRGLLDTAPAVMLAADWLVEQPFVDPDRLELAGGSLGAFVVPVAGALDARFRRVWLVHGGGDPARVIEHGLASNIRFPPLRALAARFLSAAAAGRHLAPERWVGRIAPRPVIVISALDDESIPRECVEALHLSLGRPSEVIWMSGGHVRPGREALIREITDLVFDRISREGLPAAPAPANLAPGPGDAPA